MEKITPFLWFDGKAEEAARFYVSIFRNARITELRPPMSASFEIEGRGFIAFNGGPMFRFSPAISLFVNCESQQEVDELAGKLAEGGEQQACGWVKDRYGLSWQVIPRQLSAALQHRDPQRAQRAAQAMMKMKKIDIAEIERVVA